MKKYTLSFLLLLISLYANAQKPDNPGFNVGFLAQSPTGTRCEVKFSNIRYEKKKIKDPYLGE